MPDPRSPDRRQRGHPRLRRRGHIADHPGTQPRQLGAAGVRRPDRRQPRSARPGRYGRGDAGADGCRGHCGSANVFPTPLSRSPRIDVSAAGGAAARIPVPPQAKSSPRSPKRRDRCWPTCPCSRLPNCRGTPRPVAKLWKLRKGLYAAVAGRPRVGDHRPARGRGGAGRPTRGHLRRSGRAVRPVPLPGLGDLRSRQGRQHPLPAHRPLRRRRATAPVRRLHRGHGGSRSRHRVVRSRPNTAPDA